MRPPICDKTVPPHLENPGSATGVDTCLSTNSLEKSTFYRPVPSSSRRKVQKLRDQSQYISKNVRALQYWRWACGTCCKQYHMLFYIQMAVVSTAIFFLFSPSFSFFLEIKVQIYIYFHNKCQYINQFPPKP